MYKPIWPLLNVSSMEMRKLGHPTAETPLFNLRNTVETERKKSEQVFEPSPRLV